MTNFLLSNGEQQFADANGVPLASGTVDFYLPGTTTRKDTWRDPDGTVLNTNPVVLDSAGRAVIFGSGEYRQVVTDRLGNLIWDAVTGVPFVTSTSVWGGVATGTGTAIVLSNVAWSGADGTIIGFIAGASSTGATTVAVNGASPVTLEKNGAAGAAAIAAGDIVAGNFYLLAYQASANVFILSGLVTATQAVAEAGIDTYFAMSAKNVVDLVGNYASLVLANGTTATTQALLDGTTKVATDAYVDRQTKLYDVQHFYDSTSLTVAAAFATTSSVTVGKKTTNQLVFCEYGFFVGSGSLAAGSQIRLFNVTDNRAIITETLTSALSAGQTYSMAMFDNAAVLDSSVNYVVQVLTPSGSAGLTNRFMQGTSYVN